jgi:hypothetical protein
MWRAVIASFQAQSDSPITSVLLLVATTAGLVPMLSPELQLPALAIAALGLFVAVWVQFIRPFIRRRKLRRPVDAYFTVRNTKRSISGRDAEQGDPHWVHKLVLPSNQISEVEIGVMPRLEFYAKELIVGCKGAATERPEFIERADTFVESGARPSSDKDYRSKGAYHRMVDKDYNVGTHHVAGFRLETKSAGRYPVTLSFVTNEIEGNFDRLEIIVEDDPKTIMQCQIKKHGRDCRVSPFDLP